MGNLVNLENPPCPVRHSGKPLHLHSLRLFGNSIVQAVNDHPHGSALNLLCPRVSSEITVEVILCKYSRQIHSQTKLASEESAQANCGFRQARPDPPAHQGTRNRKRRCTQGTHAQRAHVTPKGVPRLVACSTRATRESQ